MLYDVNCFQTERGTGPAEKKKRKHDFGLLALESRGQRVMLGLFCHSEGWFIAADLIRDQSHTLIGPGLVGPLTVHGDLHSPYHGCSHVVGGAAFIVPRLLPSDALNFQVLVFTHKADGCRRKNGAE